MATPGAGIPSSVSSSLTFQLLLRLTTVYFVFYFLTTLGLIIRKSLVLSYPAEDLECDVGLLLLLAALDAIHFFCGVKGDLKESEGYVLASLMVMAPAVALTVYFLVWQTYVTWADEILSGVLLVFYGLDGVLAVSTVARQVVDSQDTVITGCRGL